MITKTLFSLLSLLLAMPSYAQRPRARDLGIQIGTLPMGTYNAITDVEGVLVGHVTLIEGSGELVVGKGPVRTGVTAIVPHGEDIYRNNVFAAAEALNGNGEMTGMAWVNERGQLEVPLVLTNTLSVGEGYSGVVAYMLKQGTGRVPLPVVAECYDGGLNDIAGRHVTVNHVVEAIETATGGAVPEGSVGAGTGMRSYGFKAGIGTASRVVPDGHTVGVLVNANCGRRRELLIAGVPVGPRIARSDFPNARWLDHCGHSHRRAPRPTSIAPPVQTRRHRHWPHGHGFSHQQWGFCPLPFQPPIAYRALALTAIQLPHSAMAG